MHFEAAAGFFPPLALNDCKLSWALLQRRVELLEAEFEEVLKNAGQAQATGPASDGWEVSGSRIRLVDLRLQLAKSQLRCKKLDCQRLVEEEKMNRLEELPEMERFSRAEQWLKGQDMLLDRLLVGLQQQQFLLSEIQMLDPESIEARMDGLFVRWQKAQAESMLAANALLLVQLSRYFNDPLESDKEALQRELLKKKKNSLFLAQLKYWLGLWDWSQMPGRQAEATALLQLHEHLALTPQGVLLPSDVEWLLENAPSWQDFAQRTALQFEVTSAALRLSCSWGGKTYRAEFYPNGQRFEIDGAPVSAALWRIQVFGSFARQFTSLNPPLRQRLWDILQKLLAVRFPG